MPFSVHFRKLVSVFALSAWALAAFHLHAADAGELHAHHNPCQACVQTHRTLQTVLPAPETALSLPDQGAFESPDAQSLRIKSQTHASFLSRAPPLP